MRNRLVPTCSGRHTDANSSVPKLTSVASVSATKGFPELRAICFPGVHLCDLASTKTRIECPTFPERVCQVRVVFIEGTEVPQRMVVIVAAVFFCSAVMLVVSLIRWALTVVMRRRHSAGGSSLHRVALRSTCFAQLRISPPYQLPGHSESSKAGFPQINNLSRETPEDRRRQTATGDFAPYQLLMMIDVLFGSSVSGTMYSTVLSADGRRCPCH